MSLREANSSGTTLVPSLLCVCMSGAVHASDEKKAAELGAISFERPGLVDYLREGSQPRKFFVLLPALDTEGVPVSHEVDRFDADSDLVTKKR